MTILNARSADSETRCLLSDIAVYYVLLFVNLLKREQETNVKYRRQQRFKQNTTTEDPATTNRCS